MVPRGGFARPCRCLFLSTQPDVLAVVVAVAKWHDEPELLRVRGEYLLFFFVVAGNC